MDVTLQADRDTLVNRFRQLQTLEDIAFLLEVPPSVLIYYLYRLTPEKKYKKFSIKKRNGDSRELFEPVPGLKIIQKKLLTILSYLYVPRSSVHGFVTGRSVATNAQLHEGQNFLLNIDIKDFFPSINFGRVRGMFMSTPFKLPPDVSTILAQICCVNNMLPQGSPTSPLISNMVCFKLDGDLQRLASKRKCIYSRYADDITFSTSGIKFPKALAYFDMLELSKVLLIGNELKATIEDNGFTINGHKTRLSHKSERQIVTGLIVNQTVNVKRSYVRQIRAMLHAWRKYGAEDARREFATKYDNRNRAPFLPPPSFRRVLEGKLNYLAMIRGNDDNVYQNLLHKYAQLNSRYLMQPIGSQPNHLKTFEDALWVIEYEKVVDEDLECFQGTGFFLEGYGLVTCEHVVRGEAYAFKSKCPDQRYKVDIVRSNKVRDLAILKIDVPTTHHLIPSASPPPRNDSIIKVAGYLSWADGNSLWRATGIVTGHRRRLTEQRITVSCPIGGGASGGPATDQFGRVIGIVAAGDASRAIYEIIPLESLIELANATT